MLYLSNHHSEISHPYSSLGLFVMRAAGFTLIFTLDLQSLNLENYRVHLPGPPENYVVLKLLTPQNMSKHF